MNLIDGKIGAKEGWLYSLEDGLQVREVNIEPVDQEKPKVKIAQITDLHFNYMNEEDLKEKNPILMSTLEHRWWLEKGEGVLFAKRPLEYADLSADQTVITGDVMDYLSKGAAELLHKEIWDKYPEMLVTTGNHEWCQNMEGTVPEVLSFEERKEKLEKIWKHNLYYYSRVIKESVMLILLENGKPGFWKCQEEPLKKDIETAREKGYTVLIFAHIPINTNNPEYALVTSSPEKRTDDFTSRAVICPDTGEESENVYDIITHNADVIKGIFTGHFHHDYYTEVKAETFDGKETTIPQYVVSGPHFNKYAGRLMIINI